MQRAAIVVAGLVLAGAALRHTGTVRAQSPLPIGAAELPRRADDVRQASSPRHEDELQALRTDDLPHGGGIIRGVVTSAASGAPVAGATVRAVLATANASPVTSATDENGAFECRGLTPGRWRIGASRSGFLPRESGQRGRAGPGSSIELKDRGQATANIALLRGGVIAGHVFDGFGDPAVGVRVQVMQFTRVENGRRLVPAGAPDSTDDTGAFRIHNLPPGDYLVSARASSPFDGGLIRVVGNRTERQFVTESGAFMYRDGARVFLPTYFPGTFEIGGAAQITLAPESEHTGVDFTLSNATPTRVSGIVLDSSGETVSRAVPVSLFSDSLDTSTTFMASRPVTAGGAFDFPEVPPGSYVVAVGLAGANGRPESAEVPVTVGGEDITGLQLVTAPGGSLTGSVVFDNGGRQSTQGMIVAASSVTGRRMAAASSASGAVLDGSFQIPNLLGTFRLSVDRVPAGWMLKAIDVDGVDVTDTPVTVKSGRSRATIVLTNRLTDLSGTVTNDGKPIDADILIFPDDPAKWTAWRFVRSLRANEQGMFSIKGLPPHDNYLALATSYLEPDDVLNPEFLELARSRATSFSLEEGQARGVRLTLIDRSELDGR